MNKSAATKRMAQHRASMKAKGFKLLQTHVPVEVDAFLDQQKSELRVASKGDALAHLIADVQRLRKLEEEGQFAG